MGEHKAYSEGTRKLARTIREFSEQNYVVADELPGPGAINRSERHAQSRTTHASLLSEIRVLLSGAAPTGLTGDVESPAEPLSESELRVLRYLPTNLHASEIAAELFVSLNTIRTHMRNVYTKLGVHSRADAVKRARELGLLSPTSLSR